MCHITIKFTKMILKIKSIFFKYPKQAQSLYYFAGDQPYDQLARLTRKIVFYCHASVWQSLCHAYFVTCFGTSGFRCINICKYTGAGSAEY